MLGVWPEGRGGGGGAPATLPLLVSFWQGPACRSAADSAGTSDFSA